MAYRLFVDEVGNADLKSSKDPNHRYLSLTGVVVNMDKYDSEMDFRFKKLKRDHFNNEAIIFHRRDMLNATGPFNVLKDSERRNAFNEDLLKALKELKYVAITVSIDKQAHQAKYGRWQFASYHYCMTCLVERYVKWLNRFPNLRGDVMAESRNRIEDEKLKDSYTRFFRKGSLYERERKRLDRLTSNELKLHKKQANINGLQMADLLASPSFRRMLCEREGVEMKASFGRRVADILLEKYDTSGGIQGIPGYGTKWLP